MANGVGDNTVRVLLGRGDGTFAEARTYAVGTTPFALALADFNGDDKLDLAVANRGSMNVTVMTQGEDGGLGRAGSYELGRAPAGLAVGDFDGDGAADLVTVNATERKNLSVLLRCPRSGDASR